MFAVIFACSASVLFLVFSGILTVPISATVSIIGIINSLFVVNFYVVPVTCQHCRYSNNNFVVLVTFV